MSEITAPFESIGESNEPSEDDIIDALPLHLRNKVLKTYGDKINPCSVEERAAFPYRKLAVRYAVAIPIGFVALAMMLTIVLIPVSLAMFAWCGAYIAKPWQEWFASTKPEKDLEKS